MSNARVPKGVKTRTTQRFPSFNAAPARQLNVHFHILCADCAFCKNANGIAFIRAPPLKQAVVEHVFADMLGCIERQCKMTMKSGAF